MLTVLTGENGRRQSLGYCNEVLFDRLRACLGPRNCNF